MIMYNKNDYSTDMAYADSKDLNRKTNKFIFLKMSKINPLVRIDQVSDLELQYAGIDKILHTRQNKFLKLEEKVRRVDWGDILVELIADDRYANYDLNNNKYTYSEKRGIGWGMKDYSSDLLLYFFEESQTGYLISWVKFKNMFRQMLPIWYRKAQNNEDNFAIKIAKNKKYNSINIAIPKKEFENYYIKFGGEII